MQPLSEIVCVSSMCTVKEMRERIAQHKLSFLLLFQHTLKNIVAVAYPRDCLRAEDNKRVRDLAKPPWFIVQTASIIEILKQFRSNKQILSVVLDQKGQAVGILTLDDIIDEVFEQSDSWLSLDNIPSNQLQVMIERSFPGETLLSTLKNQYHVNLAYQDTTTLEEFCEKLLGHKPAKGDELRFESYEITIEEAPLIGSLEIFIRSIS